MLRKKCERSRFEISCFEIETDTMNTAKFFDHQALFVRSYCNHACVYYERGLLLWLIDGMRVFDTSEHAVPNQRKIVDLK